MQTAIASFELSADRTCTVTRVEIAVGSAPDQKPPIIHQPDPSPLVLAVGARATLSLQVFDTLAGERRSCSDAIPFRMLINGWDVDVADLPAGLFDCQVLRVSAARPHCLHSALDTRCRTAD